MNGHEESQSAKSTTSVSIWRHVPFFGRAATPPTASEPKKMSELTPTPQGSEECTEVSHASQEISSKHRNAFVGMIDFALGNRETKSAGLVGSFIEIEVQSDDFIEGNHAEARRKLNHILESERMEVILAIPVLINTVFLIMEADLRAAEGDIPKWLEWFMNVYFFQHLVEFALVVFIKRMLIFSNIWDIFDLFICVTGVIELFLHFFFHTAASEMVLRILRPIRIFRINRLIKRLSLIRTVKKLLFMADSCLRSLFWAFFLSFILMLVWSMIAVKLVSLLRKDVAEQGYWIHNHDSLEAFDTAPKT